MNRKTITALLLAFFMSICITGMASCAESGKSEDKTYTVIWKNGDTVLETDKNVKAGSIPTFDGATPYKDSDAQYSYTFAGWSPEIGAVTKDVTYTATFTSVTNKYTVTWHNYDGEVLETDKDVPYGTTPTYNGQTPQKEGTDDMRYIFSGWTPSVDTVTGNMIYTAKFTEQNVGELVAGVDPVFSADGKTVRYGFYPQTHVNDETTIAALNALTAPEANGMYLYDGDRYVKETANVCNGESYVFDDGTTIVDGDEYWFKCEVITWRVINDENGLYYLISDKLLDACAYYTDYADRTADGKTVYANNYEKSAIRNWLNSDFYGIAFAPNNTYVKATTVNNGGATTETDNNKYTCGDTTDKVYFPSYKDYLNAEYGFDTDAAEKSATRECKTTDYARARGAWCNAKYNGSYWTRSPSDKYGYCAWNVNSGGYLSEYAVDGDSHCVRPCISLYFPE